MGCEFFCRCFSYTACDADHFGMEVCRRFCGQCLQGLEGIAHLDESDVGFLIRHPLADYSPGGTLLRGMRHKVMAVPLGLDGKKQLSWLGEPGIDIVMLEAELRSSLQDPALHPLCQFL